MNYSGLQSHITLITPICASPTPVRTDATAGNLLVKFENMSQCAFQFVTYASPQ